MKILWIALSFAGLLASSESLTAAEPSRDELAKAFANPPASARPLTWWHWMSGLISREGITADLEAMQKAGIGGAYLFHVGVLPIDGPVRFRSDEWWSLMRFAAAEADRLGLEFGFHNGPGWSSSGGPWVPVEKSMQKVVWSERSFTGPGRFHAELPRPKVDPKWDFYRDIAVLAVPAKDPVPQSEILDLSAKLSAAGELDWEAPAGEWTILRFGRTTTGAVCAPAAPDAVGLECDKLDRQGVDVHFDQYVAKILENAGPSTGKSLRTVLIDSYEVGEQNWSPSFREEFRKRRGYDPVPWLIAATKRVVNDPVQTGRFEYDWTKTIAELFADNYYGYMAERTRRYPGLKLAVEPYSGPFDTVTCGTRADVVAAEFWQDPSPWGWNLIKTVASSAHIAGTRLVGAEAFTGNPRYAKWAQDPYALKAVGDRSFALGVNQLILHTTAHQPWMNAWPGMTMGWWGTQFGRTQTWWNQAHAWTAYLTRSQYLLQAGRFVADICYLGEGTAPQGYDADSINEGMLVKSMAVSDGRLTLPSGMSYRVLVLPDRTTMTPAVARKLRELANAGAKIIGPKPLTSPSLQDYPACDREVQQIGREMWDSGKVLPAGSLMETLSDLKVLPDFEADAGGIVWTHRRIGDSEVYFVSNQESVERTIEGRFRVAGKRPEFWDAASGEIRAAAVSSTDRGLTRVPLKLDPRASVFVVFAGAAQGGAKGRNWDEFQPFHEIAGPWNVKFDPRWGGPAQVTFARLTDWTQRIEEGIRYYSGTAVYEKEFDAPNKGGRIFLDLGAVRNLAEVRLNAKDLGVVWKPPFRVEVTGTLRPGRNKLEVRVVNLWPNRLIGDEQQPDDRVLDEVNSFQDEAVGRPLKKVPEWLIEDKPRPSKGRYTITSWNYYTKDSPLVESGLLGPVRLLELARSR